jgi:di/tripeptidase
MRLEPKLLKGKSVHPGYAKGKMINSMLIANEFINALPIDETPQETKGYEGFIMCITYPEALKKLFRIDN